MPRQGEPVNQPNDEKEKNEHKQDLLALRGGLKGRFASEFAVLQSSLDALTRYAGTCADRAFATDATSMLTEMAHRVARIERLANNAAELATSTALNQAYKLYPVELYGYLSELCACAEEELLHSGREVAVTFEQSPDEEGDIPRALWIAGDSGLMDSLFVNLLSNSAAGQCSAVSIRMDGTTLVYSDNGPGLPARCRALLLEGRMDGELLAHGDTGLLLVREYAGALGWNISMEAGENAKIRFITTPLDAEKAAASADMRNNTIGERRMLRKNLRREFTATLQPT